MTDPLSGIWDSLTSAALLGTERRPFELTQPANGSLGEALASLQKQSGGNSEHLLLSSAALIALYRQAGALPLHDERPLSTLAPPETLATCSPRAGTHLHALLSGDNAPALGEWLETTARYSKIVPYDLLASLLFLGQAQPAYRAAILPVIGNRGRWLASLYTGDGDWAYVRNAAIIETPDEESTLALWETGSPDARFAVLRDMRATQPNRARDLLAGVWKQENAKTRNNLLRSLGTNLSLADELFLESALEDRSSEVASTASEYLSFLPDSKLVQRSTAIATAALKLNRAKQTKLFGLGQSTDKSTIEVTLPETFTPAMKRDQIAEKPNTSNQIKAGIHAWWLLQVLGRTPPRVWTELWQATPGEIIAAALRSKDWKDLLMQGFTRAALTHSNPDWAEAVLAFGFSAMEEYGSDKMVGILSPERRNEVVISILSAHPEALYTDDMPLDIIWTLQKPWTIELSRAILNSVAHHVKNNTPKNGIWQISQSLSTFAYSMPPSLLAEAERVLVTNESTSPNIKTATDDFLTTLKFRQDMLTALAQ